MLWLREAATDENIETKSRKSTDGSITVVVVIFFYLLWSVSINISMYVYITVKRERENIDWWFTDLAIHFDFWRPFFLWETTREVGRCVVHST